jgi:hypothetical protein
MQFERKCVGISVTKWLEKFAQFWEKMWPKEGPKHQKA